MKMKFDAASVAALACPPGKRRLDAYSTDQPGLLLEVRPSGGKTYYVRYTDKQARLSR